MDKILNVSAGLSTIGNVLDANIELETLINIGDISSLKTLNNAIWKTWTQGAPAAFQGFSELMPGKGYVVNALNATTLTLSGTGLVNINAIEDNVGLNMLAFPFNGKSIGDGYVPKFKMNSLKTIDGGWKSWIDGSEPAFQGFTTIDDSKGYVVDIDVSYGDVVYGGSQDNANGVRFNLNDTTVSNGVTLEGVTYTDPNAVGALSFDKVVYDETVPVKVMFFSVEGNIAKIDFPEEYTDVDFYITHNGSVYKGNFTENESYSVPTVVDTIVTVNDIIISHVAKTISTEPVMKTMTLVADGNTSVFEFASEYTGDEFKVWKSDGTIAIGTFAEGEVTVV